LEKYKTTCKNATLREPLKIAFVTSKNEFLEVPLSWFN
jgi:hypothetical protein